MYVKADIDSIERVLINLMHNAVKFVQQNGKIKVSTSSYKNKVLVCVEDNGIGIDRKIQKQRKRRCRPWTCHSQKHNKRPQAGNLG